MIITDSDNNTSSLKRIDIIHDIQIFGQNEIIEIANENSTINMFVEKFCDISYSESKNKIGKYYKFYKKIRIKFVRKTNVLQNNKIICRN